MLAILSPAKTLDYSPRKLTARRSMPAFLDQSEELIAQLQRMPVRRLRELMGISDELAAMNHARFQEWRRPFPKGAAKQALLAFKGDVYQGFDLESYTDDDWAYAQDHLRILSGLYGLLRPLDLMLPYRLEMGTPMKNARGRDLYAFWGDRLTRELAKALKKQGDEVLINLASKEYSRALQLGDLRATVIIPVFKDWKNGELKMITFFAKRARGAMADYVIRHRVADLEALRAFDTDGYQFDPERSTETAPVFTRTER